MSSSTVVGVSSLLLTAVIWGMTNPLMKRGSAGITKIEHDNVVARFALEFFFLFSRWQYVVPFLINIMGSVVFYYSLANLEMSIVVPAVNSLTFLITHLMSIMLGDERIGRSGYIGMGLVVLGVAICVDSVARAEQ